MKGSGKENPTKETIKDCWEYYRFEGNGFGWYGGKRVREYGMEALYFTMHNPVSNGFFLRLRPILVLWKIKKNGEWRKWEVGVKTSMYLRNSCSNYLNIYTDGSKNKQESVGIGIHIPEFKIDISKRITDQLSVYTAKPVAVIIALQWVEVKPDRVTVCTDSLAVMKSIQSMTSVKEDLLIDLYHSLLKIHRGGIDQFSYVGYQHMRL